MRFLQAIRNEVEDRTRKLKRGAKKIEPGSFPFQSKEKNVGSTKGRNRRRGNVRSVGSSGSDTPVTLPTLAEYNLAVPIELQTNSGCSDGSLSTMSSIFPSKYHIPGKTKPQVLALPPISSSLDDDSTMTDPSVVLNQILTLKEKLVTQEDTKKQLLNQCLVLQKKVIDTEETPPAYINTLRKENKELKSTIAEIESNFMNDMQELIEKMNEMSDNLSERDDKIRILEGELQMLGCCDL